MRKIVSCSIIACVVFFMSLSVSYADGVDIYNDLGPTTFDGSGMPIGPDVYWYDVAEGPNPNDTLALDLLPVAITDINDSAGGMFGVGLSFQMPFATEYVTFGLGSLDLTTSGGFSTISASSQGSYRNDGVSFPTAMIGLPSDNYDESYNAFYLFDLSSFGGGAVSATLNLFIQEMSYPGTWFGFGAYDVITDLSELAPVPEPATMLLFGTGLFGLVGISIRRRKK